MQQWLFYKVFKYSQPYIGWLCKQTVTHLFLIVITYQCDLLIVTSTDDSLGESVSDDEDDDEEEDQDLLEADLDKSELIKAHEVENIGDKFLSVNYSEPANGTHRKKRVLLCCVLCVRFTTS